MNTKAIEKCLNQIDTLNKQIYSLKRVVRVPRLARNFQDLYEKVPIAEQLGAHIRSKSVDEILEQNSSMDKLDHDAIIHALRA